MCVCVTWDEGCACAYNLCIYFFIHGNMRERERRFLGKRKGTKFLCVDTSLKILIHTHTRTIYIHITYIYFSKNILHRHTYVMYISMCVYTYLGRVQREKGAL